MYHLTRIELSDEAASKKGLTDLYKWHKAAWKLFPGRPDAERDFLFRLNSIPGGYEFLVLSKTEPVKCEWCSAEQFAVKNISSKFLEHRYYLFDILANPTRKIAVNNNGIFKKNGKRVVLTKLEDQWNWFKRKSEAAGFKVLDKPELIIEPAQNYGFVRGMDYANHGLHVGVKYKGILEVQDKELFKKSFKQGIGSAKGFGFGMLILKPIQL